MKYTRLIKISSSVG